MKIYTSYKNISKWNFSTFFASVSKYFCNKKLQFLSFIGFFVPVLDKSTKLLKNEELSSEKKKEMLLEIKGWLRDYTELSRRPGNRRWAADYTAEEKALIEERIRNGYYTERAETIKSVQDWRCSGNLGNIENAPECIKHIVSKYIQIFPEEKKSFLELIYLWFSDILLLENSFFILPVIICVFIFILFLVSLRSSMMLSWLNYYFIFFISFFWFLGFFFIWNLFFYTSYEGINYWGFSFDKYTLFVQVFLIFFILILFILFYFFLEKYSFNSWLLYGILYLSGLGLLHLTSCKSLLNFSISLEVITWITFYLLYLVQTPTTGKAAYRYFLISLIISGILFLSLILIFLESNTLVFSELAEFNLIYTPTFTFKLALFFFFTSFFIKMGMFPFHAWLLEVSEKGTRISLLFLLCIVKFAIFCVLYHLFYFVFFNVLELYLILFYSTILFSFLVGGFLVFNQNHILRFLGAASIPQMGFLFFLNIGYFVPGIFEKQFIYLCVYISSLIIIFSFILFFEIRGSVLRSYNYSNLSLVVALFSLAGLPPLAGFFSKFYILQIAFDNNLWFYFFFSIFISIISAIYYIRFLKKIFYEKNIKGDLEYKQTNFYSELDTIQNLIIFPFSFFLISWIFFEKDFFLLLFWLIH